MTEDDFPAFQTGEPAVANDAVALTATLTRFLNSTAAVKPDHDVIEQLIGDLEQWSGRLNGNAGTEDESLWRKARRNQPPALLPSLSFVEDGLRLTGKVTFGRFHIGRGAAHGGAISLVFDEVMGALAASGNRPVARTANLTVDFRALTPIDKELSIHAAFDSEDGRKRFLSASISDGDVVCAKARGLWIELRPKPAEQN